MTDVKRQGVLSTLEQILRTAQRAQTAPEGTASDWAAVGSAAQTLLQQLRPGVDSTSDTREFHTAHYTAVLLVEADEAFRRQLSQRLGNHGYHVTIAESGAEGLTACDNRHFDLLLASDTLSDMKGSDFIDRIRTRFATRSLPIILIGDADLVELGTQVGEGHANDCVARPVNVGMLCVRMETHLALARTLRAVDQLNQSLRQAQDEILRLEDRALDALKDVGAWTKTMSQDLGRTLGTEELGVWVWEGAIMRPITQAGTDPPKGPDLMMAVRSPHHHFVRANDVVVAIIGMTGELFGGIVVPDRNKIIGESGLRILSTFARQLGGALELQRLRGAIDQAEFEKKAADQQLEHRVVDGMKMCQWCGRCYPYELTTCEDDGVTLSPRRLVPYRIQKHYRLMRKLAEGGMGTIFLAHDEALDREVAIKILNQQHFNSTQAHLRFEHEAKALARIEHPNVITVYDSGRLADGSVFIVMERLKGYALDKAIEQFGRGAPEQVAVLLRQGAGALTAAHDASVLHRDIKPENIFLVEGPNGYRVKLLDFGIAKNMRVETTITQAGVLIGTPAYMAPEQINGQPADIRTDLYSFATVCYEALTGRPVTMEKELGMVIIDIVDNDPPPPSTLVPGLPLAVDEAFACALHKNPQSRPISVMDWVMSFVDHLEQIDGGPQEWPFRMQTRKRR